MVRRVLCGRGAGAGGYIGDTVNDAISISTIIQTKNALYPSPAQPAIFQSVNTCALFQLHFIVYTKIGNYIRRNEFCVCVVHPDYVCACVGANMQKVCVCVLLSLVRFQKPPEHKFQSFWARALFFCKISFKEFFTFYDQWHVNYKFSIKYHP